ncbi:MAG: type II toxin-antitoxin system PemK/MazF family toxin [Candidatus Micrarchaeota archaeon]
MNDENHEDCKNRKGLRKGEVWLTEFPGGSGREQRGLRPAMVLGAANGVATIVPFTTNSKIIEKDFTIGFEPSSENGLTEYSVALVFQLTAVDERFFVRKLGWIPKEQREDVDDLLKKLLKLSE